MKNYTTIIVFLITIAFSLHGEATGFPEPPATLYGKVIHVDAGSSYQVLSGELSVTLTNPNQPSNTVTLITSLQPSGLNGAFSYQLKVPQQYLPSDADLTETVAVNETNVSFQFDSIIVNGVSASPLDTAQALLDISFDNRAQEHRLDLQVNLPVTDTDGDGLPDWWEDANGLNKLFAGDASSDADGDGWDALTEFQNSSDPNVSNAAATLVSSSIWIVRYGESGVTFDVRDANDIPADISFRINSLPSGFFVFRYPSIVSALPLNFTYQDILDGKITVVATTALAPGSEFTLDMTMTDSEVANQPVSLTLRTLDPLSLDVRKPTLWLHTDQAAIENASNFSAVSEWSDSSPSSRTVFQPTTNYQPVVRNGLERSSLLFGYDHTNFPASFPSNDPSRFFFVDDAGLDLEEYTVFCKFQIVNFSSIGITQQNDPAIESTLISLSDFKLSIDAENKPQSSRSFKVTRNGSSTIGSAATIGFEYICTAVGTQTGDQLTIDEYNPLQNSNNPVRRLIGSYTSRANASTLSPVFPSLGAKVDVATGQPTEPTHSQFYELLIYDTALEPETVSRIDDYLNTINRDATIWDMRYRTTPITLLGNQHKAMLISGGWANDTLAGSGNADVLRGGPGDDILRGNGNRDRFQFFIGDSNDTIEDFNGTSGTSDQLDLRAIFKDKTGLPEQYIELELSFTIQPGQVPVANTLVKLDFEGDGGEPDMVITLKNVSYSNADLPRLVGEQIFNLGGPRYPLAVEVNASELKLTETEYNRTLTVTRNGNAEGALDVYLGFTGTSTADTDFSLAQIQQNGLVHTVSFAAGQTEANFDLTPIQDALTESETIQIAVLPSPQVPEIADDFLSLSLDDAPQIEITTTVPYAQRHGQVPGVLTVTRGGDLTEPLDIDLVLGGTAVNGRDYQLVSPSVSFASGQATQEIRIVPNPDTFGRGEGLIAQVSVIPDTTRYMLKDVWTASVLIVDSVEGGAQTLQGWAASNGLTFGPGFENQNSGDGDFFTNIIEYGFGLDASAPDSFTSVTPQVYTVDGFLEIWIATAVGLTDVRFELVTSTDGINFVNAEDKFTATTEAPVNGKIQRRYRSKFPASSFTGSNLYSIAITYAGTPHVASSAAVVLSNGTLPYIVTGSAPWLPSTGEGIMQTPALLDNQSSSIVLNMQGPAQLQFDWKVSSEASNDLLSLYVDGQLVSSISGEVDWTAVTYDLNDSSNHKVELVYSKNGSSSAGADRAFVRNVVKGAL